MKRMDRPRLRPAAPGPEERPLIPRPYATPELTVYGSITELTRLNSGGVNFDNPGMETNMTS